MVLDIVSLLKSVITVSWKANLCKSSHCLSFSYSLYCTLPMHKKSDSISQKKPPKQTTADCPFNLWDDSIANQHNPSGHSSEKWSRVVKWSPPGSELDKAAEETTGQTWLVQTSSEGKLGTFDRGPSVMSSTPTIGGVSTTHQRWRELLSWRVRLFRPGWHKGVLNQQAGTGSQKGWDLSGCPSKNPCVKRVQGGYGEGLLVSLKKVQLSGYLERESRA